MYEKNKSRAKIFSPSVTANARSLTQYQNYVHASDILFMQCTPVNAYAKIYKTIRLFIKVF